MKKLPFGLTRKRIVLIAALAVVVILLLDFNTRLMELTKITGQRTIVQTEVEGLMATKTTLETQIAYAQSDNAVEAWARQDAHMAKPGDQIIIPMVPKDYTPEPPMIPTPTVKPMKNWELWRLLFLGK